MTNVRRSVVVLIGFVLLSGVGGGVFLTSWLKTRNRERRWANERSAQIAIKGIGNVESYVYRSSSDTVTLRGYWAADVAGLHKLGELSRAMAEADARPIAPLVPQPVPYNGYFFVALKMDSGGDPPGDPVKGTDKPPADLHHSRGYCFLAYPENPGVSGDHMFIIIETGDWNKALRASASAPRPESCPSDEDLKKWWSQAS